MIAELMGFEGEDGATTSDDESLSDKGSPTFVGNAQLDTDQKKFGDSSLLLDGSGDYADLVNNVDFAFDGTDFTMECFVRFNSLASSAMLLSKYSTSASTAQYYLQFGDGVLAFVWYDDTLTVRSIVSNSVAPVINQWYHVAVDRVGDHMRLYLDGVVEAENASAEAFRGNSGLAFSMGRRNHTSPFYLNGWLDEVRITKGTARYQGAFTPPTAPFPRTA